MSATAHPAASAVVRRPFRALRFTRDEELVRLVRAGDERAFEAMYDRHHRGILAFCRHMLGSAEEAEDAVQHTFIAAHRDLVGTDKPMQLKAWLYTIARNRCLSVLRARKEERALDEVPEPSVQGLASETEQRQDLRDLLIDLQRLPEDQRAALVLSELGALSHEEIGATLGVRKDKVKALVFQARESLASSRTARDADCREIQEQLAVLRGGSLRRTTLRRHVEVCPACAAFKAEVKRQRGAMAAILPVVPSLALKESVLAGIFGGGAAGGGGIIGGGLVAASGGKALVAKVATIAAVAGSATGGGLMAVDKISNDGRGNTATAMAGIPPEQRSLQMVESLRERARDTAAERAADRAAGAETRPASTTTTASSRVMPVRRRRSSTRAERRGAAVATTGVGHGTAPASAPGPSPAATTPPATAPQERKSKPVKQQKHAERQERRSAKSGKLRGPGIDPHPDRGRDGERGHRIKGIAKEVAPAVTKPAKKLDRRNRKRKPAKAPAPRVAPQPAPQPPKPERDGPERGRARPDEPPKKATAAAAGVVEDATKAAAGILP